MTSFLSFPFIPSILSKYGIPLVIGCPLRLMHIPILRGKERKEKKERKEGKRW